MSLREHTVYLRLTFLEDVIVPSSGHSLTPTLVTDAEELVGGEFTEMENTARRTGFRERTPERESEWAPSNAGGDVHPTYRLAWRGTLDGRSVTLSLSGGPHPYTGEYVVLYELRMPDCLFDTAGVADRLDALTRSYVQRWKTLCAHAHHTDDNAIQNCALPGLLRSGFDLDPDTVDLEDAPGRETSRGAERYVVNWRTWLGERMMGRLERFGGALPDGVGESVSDGVWVALYDDPRDADQPRNRAFQKEVRDALRIDDATEASARAFGFWQRAKPDQ